MTLIYLYNITNHNTLLHKPYTNYWVHSMYLIY